MLQVVSTRGITKICINQLNYLTKVLAMDKKHILPIRIALMYSFVTFVLYAFGPFSFPYLNRTLLCVFLVVTNMAMYLGFKKGVSAKVYVPQTKLKTVNLDLFINTLFWISLMICIPEFMIKTGYLSLNFNQLKLDLFTFFSSALDLYMNKLERPRVEGVWSYINYFVVLGSPFLWAYTSIAVLFWSRLSSFKKVLTCFIWITRLMIYVSTGTNVGLFDFFLTIGFAIAIKNYLGISKRGIPKLDSGTKKSILIIVLSVYIVLMIFDTSMGSRIGDSYIKGSGIGPYAINYNENSFLLQLLPASVHPLLAYITKYVAQSYIALEACLDLPFRSTFGFGYSRFLLDNMGPFSLDLWERTYPMQLEKLYHYDHNIYWHTAYCWFANDVSFIGVPFIFYHLFAYFGRAWRRFIETFNLISFLQFMIFVKMIIYLSANNQVFQGYETFLAFWILFIMNKYSNNYNWNINDYK